MSGYNVIRMVNSQGWDHTIAVPQEVVTLLDDSGNLSECAAWIWVWDEILDLRELYPQTIIKVEVTFWKEGSLDWCDSVWDSFTEFKRDYPNYPNVPEEFVILRYAATITAEFVTELILPLRKV